LETVRPCNCNRVTTGRHFLNTDCIDCWSYYFDPYWSDLWGKKEGEKPPHPLEEDIDPSLIKEEVKEKEKQKKTILPCINLGTITSRSSCNCLFKFVHKCDIHGACVRGSRIDDKIKSCQDCSEYEADTPFED
jgi:hypothetical protein